MLESRLGRGLLVTLGWWAAGLLATLPSVAAPSDLDPSFGHAGEFAVQTNAACRPGCPEFVNSYAQTLALQPDGKLLIAGRNVDNSAPYMAGPKSALFRLTGEGMLDRTFGNEGFAQAPPFDDQRLYIQTDGRPLDAGVGMGATETVIGTIGIQPYTASGAAIGAAQWLTMPAPAHGTPITADTPQTDRAGRWVSLGGTILPLVPGGGEPKLMRFLPTGALDGAFGVGGVVSLKAPNTKDLPAWPSTFALGSDGSVFVAADTHRGYSGERKAHIVIYHFTSKGRLDRLFGRDGIVVPPGGGGYEELELSAAPDGGVVLAAGEDVAGPPKRKRLLVLRYTKAGRPDNSFGYEGVVARTWISQDVIPPKTSVFPNGIVPSAITFDARGDAVVVGSKYTYTPDTGTVGNWFLARLTPRGFDCSFGPSGVVFGGVRGSANAVAIQADQRIVIAGERDHEIMAARYMGGSTPRTCSGEGKRQAPKHKLRAKRRRRH